MKRPVDVRILGQTFTVASEEGEAHVRRVAELVDAKMREVATDKGAVTTANVAILAALNIASEYQKLREEQASLKRTLDALAARVEGCLEDSLKD